MISVASMCISFDYTNCFKINDASDLCTLPSLGISWSFLMSSQVVLTISQLQWCRDVTEVLEGDFDRLEAMKEFEQKSFSVSLIK